MEENGEDHVWTVGWFTKFGISKQTAKKYVTAFSQAEMIEWVLESHARDGQSEFNQHLLEHNLDLTPSHRDAIRLGLVARSWEIGRYQLEPKEIGHGTFGSVFKAFKKGSKDEVFAIKKFDRAGDASEIFKELKMLDVPPHDNIVSILDYYTDDRKVPAMVMEYLPFNLKRFIKQRFDQNQTFTAEEVRFFLLQIALGMQHLHDSDIAHRDIKGENVLVEPSEPLTRSRVKLSDFGSAKSMAEMSMAASIVGTIGFNAPEICITMVNGHPIPSSYDPFLADVHSFGGIVYELLTGNIPWKPFGPIKELPHSESMSPEDRRFFQTLYISCRQHNPLLRPSMSDLVDVLDGREPIWILIPHHIIAIQAIIRGSAVRKILDPVPSHTISGSVYTWGHNRHKMLGYDTHEIRTSVPRMISQLTRIIQVAAGWKHCLALSADGDVMSWGTGDYCQLGVENLKQCTVPVKVNMPKRIMSIAAAYESSLAMSANYVYSWGSNACGQSGLGPDAPDVISVPRKIQGLRAGIKICAGYSHVMLLTKEGHLLAWGHNFYGQLGVGDTTDRYVPVPVTCQVSFTDISLGENHTLGMSSTGQLYSWGKNNFGELGLGDSQHRHLPTVVPNCPIFDSIQAARWRSFGLHGTTLYQWGDRIGNVPEEAEGTWNRFAGAAAIPEKVSGGIWTMLFGQTRPEALLLHRLNKVTLPDTIIAYQHGIWGGVGIMIC